MANYNANETYGREPSEEYRNNTISVDYFQAANDFGLSQMYGNVWEWCAAPWYDNSKKAPI